LRTVCAATVLAIALAAAMPNCPRAAAVDDDSADAECFALYAVYLTKVQTLRSTGAFFYFGGRLREAHSPADVERLVRLANARLRQASEEESHKIVERCEADLVSSSSKLMRLGEIATERLKSN
jgi:hypothetical protein